MDREILQAIRQTASIPSLPAVASRFLQLSSRKDCEFDDLVDLLTTDPGIAGEILRLANSALFGVSRKIGSLKQAMILLGLSKIRTMVLSRYLVQQLDRMRCPGLKIGHYWRRSLTCAALSARFCEQYDKRLREEGFASGLLADLGVVVLAAALPERYGPIAREYEPLHSDLWVTREQHAMGISHAEISALVLHDWMLPETIVEAVRNHHCTTRLTPELDLGMKLGCLVSAACQTAQLLCDTPDAERTRTLCEQAREQIGLPLEVVINALRGIEEDLEDIISLLGVKAAHDPAYERIGQQLATQLTADHGG